MTDGLTRRSAMQVMAAAAAASLVRTEQTAYAAVPSAFKDGATPQDVRLGALKDLNGYFPFTPSASPEEWKQRAEAVRRQVLVSCGLWPMPARPPVTAHIHGKVERDDYTVEKVSFESHPGLYVTGSLYRPATANGKRPAVLCPHGHWASGRFHDHGEAQTKVQLKKGAEKFPVGGRHPLQARSVHLARMGCVVFLYDMLGYADNQMLSYELIHRFAKQRPELSQPDRWGMFSAQSELWLLNALGLQTWNSIRALDWIETLPDVDASRIAVTGASGGGTQTFLLGAVDPRPAAFFPAVMVSTSMQGGCTCENASYLRVGTGNIEFAAMLAPRTVGLSAADDWTKELETKGLPELKQHFEMLGIPDRLSGQYLPFEHNFNHPSRALMYGVFQKALGLEQAPLEERDYQPLTREEASVWTADHPAPAAGDEAELKVLRGFVAEFERQLRELTPQNAASLKTYREQIGGGWQVLLGRDLESAGESKSEKRGEVERDGYEEFVGVINNATHREQVPFVAFMPELWNDQLVIWLTDTGKAGLFDAAGQPVPAIAKLVAAGFCVAGIDLLHQGELHVGEAPLTETRRVNNPREFLGFTVGYNHPLFAQRTHDVLTMIAAAKVNNHLPEKIHLVGEGAAALIAAAAAVQSGDSVQKVAVVTGGQRFGTITDIRDPLLLPGALRYGDVPGLLALRAPHPLMIVCDDRNRLGLTLAAYQAGGEPAALAFGETPADLLKWLME